MTGAEGWPVRLVVEQQAHPGAWNMAVDEALLEEAVAGAAPLLRWYRWSEPTLSLGYFQTGDVAQVEPALSHLPVVRRLSGGGAILHDQELTYSLALPASHPLAQNPHDVYEQVHAAVVEVLQSLGYPVNFRRTSFGKDGPEAFLCFSRGDEMDLVLQGYKVLGSAQRRRKGAVLQHGSLVYARSPAAPQFPGLFDLASAGEWRTLLTHLAQAVARRVSSHIEEADLPAAVVTRAKSLAAERYARIDWGRFPQAERIADSAT